MKAWSIKTLFAAVTVVFFVGCGVKGDPLPPETAPRLGRGHPTFTKASKQLTPDFEASRKNDKDDEETEKDKK